MTELTRQQTFAKNIWPELRFELRKIRALQAPRRGRTLIARRCQPRCLTATGTLSELPSQPSWLSYQAMAIRLTPLARTLFAEPVRVQISFVGWTGRSTIV